ncbi:anthranilate synthase alpha subunit 1, chloroplastic-like [Solanum tuberosum]|uniref:anthranilate synthase alpha subunit 1, chloroplastic-like n=1 Tax=Solanum tuberosum TaxID=4113 RepID=UPI00073A2086|nr:PREDICTED: anthranilate synthase alpha subunit 1, chloroplastic-like [Solanum tuberosum]
MRIVFSEEYLIVVDCVALEVIRKGKTQLSRTRASVSIGRGTVLDTSTRGSGWARARDYARGIAPARGRAHEVAPARGRARETSVEPHIECYERFQNIKPPEFQGGKSDDTHEFLTWCHEMHEEVGMMDARAVHFIALQLRGRASEQWRTFWRSRLSKLLICHRNVLPVSLISSQSSTSTRLHCSSLNSSSLLMDEKRFIEVSKSGNLIPLHRTIFSDHLTPVLANRCLVKEEDREAPSFLYEFCFSQGRYSVVGAQPSMEIVVKEHNVTILDHQAGKLTQKMVEDPMTISASITNGWKPRLIDVELPDTFYGGWFGYFSYDTVRYVENKKLPFLRAAEDDRNLADNQLGLYEDVIVFDHVEKKVHVIHWVRLDQYSSLPEAYLDGKKHLEILMSRVQGIESPRLSPSSVDFCIHEFGTSLTTENMTREEYKNAILQAKEHIASGDIHQIVLSQRFERRIFADPFEVYRTLRIVNPSPYMTYIQARGCTLVASSPETLTRVKKRRIVNRPLVGTSRRGRTPDEDVMLEMQMLKDEKQCAEHIMLVDLGRNDVRKVSKPGSVNVDLWLFHTIFTSMAFFPPQVSGELLDHLTCWDALRAALPVGTICGAPKVKAMELIDQLEVGRRVPYSGGFGGISFSGGMDIGLALRTLVFMNRPRYDTMYSYTDASKRQEWVAHLQSEARIVTDSDPDEKQKECEDKVACLCRSSVLKINCSVPNVFSRARGRYNMVGAQPSMEIVVKEHIMTILDHHAGKLTKKMVEDPMTIPTSISNGWKPRLIDDELPDTFCGEDPVFTNCGTSNLFN